MPAPPTSDSLIDFSLAGLVGDQSNTEVVALPNGGFAATWTDSVDMDIDGRVMQSNGGLSSFTFSATSGLTINSHSLAVLPDGRFAIAYENTSTQDVSIRLLNMDGSFFGGPIDVVAAGLQQKPVIAAM